MLPTYSSGMLTLVTLDPVGATQVPVEITLATTLPSMLIQRSEQSLTNSAISVTITHGAGSSSFADAICANAFEKISGIVNHPVQINRL